MVGTFNPGRNDPCPCMSGEKYKHCCLGVVGWDTVQKIESEFLKHVSPRGRNIIFFDKLGGILQLDKLDVRNLQRAYKEAFTAKAVVEIHHAILDVWPPDLNIAHALRNQKRKVAALYVGDYAKNSMLRGVVRNSLYADKIILMDPFLYPFKMNDQFNPILNPDQHRQQTMRNVNFYAGLKDWIDAGLVEIIRSPLDFDPTRAAAVLANQRKKVDDNPALRSAINESLASSEVTGAKKGFCEIFSARAAGHRAKKTISERSRK